ncbi:Crp/Fnr family transcriptional regulator [Pedobacter lithocola]|uniref:Crp/Fnr family transcriptional regulator n=1 Tax=Pedobacter lithocola TaxID=1908239 RepID=A0ABV8PGG7_9SPHI
MQVLGSITPLSAPFQDRIASQILTESFKAKHILLQPGETARRIYYIKEGFLRAYNVDENGKECTSWLMGANDLMISVYSFFTQRPADEYIEVLADCILQSISYHQLQSYYADFREGNYIGRVLTEKYYILSEERSIFMRTKTPEERYKILLQQHSQIEQLTTQSNIASYLGITRETLSRIRAKILRPHLTK